jgi:hypothetical protein
MKTTLSKKKHEMLYNVVHKKIMDARVEIIMNLKKQNLPYEEIDEILYKLCASTPKLALRCFEKTTPNKLNQKPE